MAWSGQIAPYKSVFVNTQQLADLPDCRSAASKSEYGSVIKESFRGRLAVAIDAYNGA